MTPRDHVKIAERRDSQAKGTSLDFFDHLVQTDISRPVVYDYQHPILGGSSRQRMAVNGLGSGCPEEVGGRGKKELLELAQKAHPGHDLEGEAGLPW